MAIPKEIIMFLKQEEKKKAYYLSLGMDEENVKNICSFDRRIFYKELFYRNKVLVFTELTKTDFYDIGYIDYLEYILAEQLSKEDDISDNSRFSWIEDIQDTRLLSKLNDLHPEEIELLTMIHVEGYQEKELVEKLGESYSTIKRKYAKIKNKMKK